MSEPTIELHVLPPSHPCKTAEAALAYKGIAFERVELPMGQQQGPMAEIYGEGNTTVPGMVVDGEPVHGSVAILERLEQLRPEPTLYPAEIAGAVREAEIWGDGELQDLGRRLPWGAMYFRPEMLGTFGGAGALDPAGTDFAMKMIRGTWKYHGITAERLAADLQSLPALLDQVAAYAGSGLIGGAEPTAADLQIGASIRVLLTVEDLRPLLEAGPAAEIAMRWFPDYPGTIPAGALPGGWVPTH